MGLVAPRHVGSSRTRARTCVPCIGRWILNRCATREAPFLICSQLEGGSGTWAGSSLRRTLSFILGMTGKAKPDARVRAASSWAPPPHRIMSRIESLTRARIDRSKELASKVGSETPVPLARGPQGALRSPAPAAPPGLPACFLGAKIGRSVGRERGGTGWVGTVSEWGGGWGSSRRYPRLQLRADSLPGSREPADLGFRGFRSGGTGCFGPRERKLLR
ncbi:hypothetical protein J1605_003338 [Eschrichtius robustus]|uniref:Uncharacterized protein n=1 Tax=Eschrichtius robustus TaxID=9764 RepID=A0AB34HMW3_ESCRO|nr:hypothetical protein J1605_003338 [Eschrichtius robustus]